jgi:hypothetical protein
MKIKHVKAYAVLTKIRPNFLNASPHYIVLFTGLPNSKLNYLVIRSFGISGRSAVNLT